MRYAIIRNGIVENLTEWDGNTAKWQPPAGTTAEVFPVGAVSIGWTWNSGAPVDPNPPIVPVVPVIDKSNVDNHDKSIRALLRMVATELNIPYGQAKQKFTAAWVAENGGGGGK